MIKHSTLFGRTLLPALVLAFATGAASAETIVRFKGGGDTVAWYNITENDVSLSLALPGCGTESYKMSPGERVVLHGLGDGSYVYQAVANLREPPPELQKIPDNMRGQGYCVPRTEQTGSFAILEGQYVEPGEPEK